MRNFKRETTINNRKENQKGKHKTYFDLIE